MTELNKETIEVELVYAELEAVTGGFIGETFSNNPTSETVSNKEKSPGETACESGPGLRLCNKT
jgi:hypothetical protein